MKREALFLAVLLLLSRSGGATCYDCKFYLDCSKPDCVYGEYCASARWLMGSESCTVSWGTCTTSVPCQYASTSQDKSTLLLASFMETSLFPISCSSGTGIQFGS